MKHIILTSEQFGQMLAQPEYKTVKGGINPINDVREEPPQDIKDELAKRAGEGNDNRGFKVVFPNEPDTIYYVKDIEQCFHSSSN